jgi:hypothetical protein
MGFGYQEAACCSVILVRFRIESRAMNAKILDEYVWSNSGEGSA